MGKSSSGHIKTTRNHQEVSIQHIDTDAPLMPVNQMLQLREFSDVSTDWMFSETTKALDHKRAVELTVIEHQKAMELQQVTANVSENKRINTKIHIERLAKLVCALLIGLTCAGCAVYLAMNGQQWVASAFVTIGIGGLAVGFLTADIKAKTIKAEESKQIAK